jgi:hypothetical protein
MGSYARGDQGPFSDVDLVRFADKGVELRPDDGSYLIDGVLVVVSTATPDRVEEWFSRPEVAVNVIAGLREARCLVERGSAFAAVQARARAFEWDAAMQTKADAWASQEMVGWIEEVHKGLEGLRRGDVGRLLNARYGCSWGLSNVMCVQRGVLLTGDNAFYDQVMEAVGVDSEWARLRQRAFGIVEEGEGPLTLEEQVRAGLRLYVLTAELLGEALQLEDEPLVRQTVELIYVTLGTSIEEGAT